MKPGANALSLRIANMDCPSEEAIIRRAFARVPGVDGLEFDLLQRKLTVVHRLPDPAPILATLESVGMPADPIPAQGANRATEAEPDTEEHRILTRENISLAASGAAAIGSEIWAYATGDQLSWPVGLLAVTAIAVGGVPTLRKGWRALRTLTLNIDLLMSVAVLGAFAIGQWPEAAIVVWLFEIAERIESASLDRARNAIKALMALAPETTLVRQGDGSWTEVNASEVEINAVMRIRPGDRIALDGVVVGGESSVDQAPITGESMPVKKGAGDRVFAGTINERGVLEVRVTAAKGETTLDRIARAVQDAHEKRAPTQRFVDRFARVYTPVVFVIALAVAIVPPLAMAQSWLEWIYRALVLLVIACPCALVISTPVTVVSALTAAARRGIVVKGGLYLEQGRLLRTIAFDKTGTLTHGRPALTDIVPIDGYPADRILPIAASLEALSEHSVAVAITSAYGSKAHAAVSEFQALPGRGVKGVIEGTPYWIGNHRQAEELRVCTPAVEAVLDRLEDEGKTAVVLATTDRVLAVLAVADSLRHASDQVVKDLRSMGISPVMLTGDNEKTAKAIAARLGIDDVRSELLPEEKLAAVESLRGAGPVGMVGDGVNDAPALARADIGFVMGGGTDVAIETADVALMQDDLHKLPDFIRLSRTASRVLWQNIGIALGLKAAVFAATLAGHGSLWLAVFADMGASLIVVFNGLRLLIKEKP